MYRYSSLEQIQEKIKKEFPLMTILLTSTKRSLTNNGVRQSCEIYNLQNTTEPADIENTRKALLEYCKMDTWAIVKLLEKLVK